MNNKILMMAMVVLCLNNSIRAMEATPANLNIETTENAKPDKDGNTPLHLAILRNEVLKAQQYIEAGKFLRVANNQNQTPEMLADIKGYPALAMQIRMMLEQQASNPSSYLQQFFSTPGPFGF